MDNIARVQCIDVLNSFKSDSTGLEDTCAVRAAEGADSHVSSFDGAYRMVTPEGLREDRYHRIYENSFSGRRSRLDESGRISLTSKHRK